jgi:hypothetical protein
MKINNPTVSYPNIVMQAASKIVTDLYENKWYEINNILCPDFSVFFLTERIMNKYLENCYFLPSHDKIFTKNEFKGIQDRIVENNILALLKDEEFILNDDEDNGFRFYLTKKGIESILEIIDKDVLKEANRFDEKTSLSFKQNVILWLVEEEFIEASVYTSQKVIKKIEEVLFMLTPKGTAHLRYIINPELLKI